MTQGFGTAGFPVTLCRIDHCGHKWQCCPAIPELFYFTAVWLGRKFLKCFHLKWGFPLELSCLPFIIMKQNSVDCAMGLSPNFLLNHLLVSIFFFSVGLQSSPGLLACDGQCPECWQKCREWNRCLYLQHTDPVIWMWLTRVWYGSWNVHTAHS